jgi:hypothetical protein
VVTKRVRSLIDAYFGRPRNEYLFLLKLSKRHGGLNDAEVALIKSELSPVHASDILRHALLVTTDAQTPH